jgi:hypothetical protein
MLERLQPRLPGRCKVELVLAGVRVSGGQEGCIEIVAADLVGIVARRRRSAAIGGRAARGQAISAIVDLA